MEWGHREHCTWLTFSPLLYSPLQSLLFPLLSPPRQHRRRRRRHPTPSCAVGCSPPGRSFFHHPPATRPPESTPPSATPDLLSVPPSLSRAISRPAITLPIFATAIDLCHKPGRITLLRESSDAASVQRRALPSSADHQRKEEEIRFLAARTPTRALPCYPWASCFSCDSHFHALYYTKYLFPERTRAPKTSPTLLSMH